MCNDLAMARRYQLKRRAERQEETRRRIVDAAIDLHSTLGPARTTLSAIAARAGVQRHTLYAHFPEARDVFLACSGDYMARNPPPDLERWTAIDDPWDRLGVALADLYGWFAANEGLLGNVLRDLEVDPLTRETAELRMGPWRAATWEVLTDGLRLGPRAAAALELALEFATWRSLVRGSGLSSDEAASLMDAAVRCAGAKGS
jgi:AcrR family transcriptional regulator